MQQSPFGVILRAENKETTKAFYERLGMTFDEHRHGDGPLHYVATFHSAMLEIYQGRESGESAGERDYRAAGETTLYIELPPGLSIQQLGPEITIVRVVRDNALVVLRDPDGRTVMVAARESAD